MALQNISKYVQLNDFLLLEYEFNRDGAKLDISNMGATVATTTVGSKQYYNNNSVYALGETNNILELNAVATDSLRSNWFNNYDYTSQYAQWFDSSLNVTTTSYEHDTVRVHVISGYNFDDVNGFLLQVRAEDSSTGLVKVDLVNFLYDKMAVIGLDAQSDVIHFASQALYLGNRFYDKYIEFKIPSVYALGNDTAGGWDTSLGQLLDVKQLSDVHIIYSSVPVVQQNNTTKNNVFNLPEQIKVDLPVTSSADRFNLFIAESQVGDFIEYYATWDDTIIGQYMGDIESGRIPLYTSNNPNDNYEEFTEQYGTDSPKWVIIHEIYVYEHFGNSSILNQSLTFTQNNNFSLPNYFRPVLRNSDIDSSFTIQYICRLTNRMDGTQIIRRGSFTSTDPKKYGLKFGRINVDNILPYKVFNKIEAEKPNILQGSGVSKTKYVKIFYDTTTIVMNEKNTIYEQGTGNMYIKNSDSVYKFKFEKINEAADQRENVDLSGAYTYALLFNLDDDSEIEVPLTYSTNMNTALGELEFKITAEQASRLLNQSLRTFYIIVKNPNGSKYTFYEGIFASLSAKQQEQTTQTNYQQQISDLNKQLTSLKSTNSDLEDALQKAGVQLKTVRDKLTGQIRTTNSLKSTNTELKSDLAALNQKVSLTQEPTDRPKTKPSVKEQALSDRVKQLEAENLNLTKKNVAIEKTVPTIKKPRVPQKTVTPRRDADIEDYQRLRGEIEDIKRPNPNKDIARERL